MMLTQVWVFAVLSRFRDASTIELQSSETVREQSKALNGCSAHKLQHQKKANL